MEKWNYQPEYQFVRPLREHQSLVLCWAWFFAISWKDLDALVNGSMVHWSMPTPVLKKWMEKKISSIVVSSHRALKSFRGGLFLDLLILFLLFCKDQLFWEGHKNLLNLPHGLNVCLVNVQTMRKIVQIFVSFSEKLNFNVVDLNNVPVFCQLP